MKRRLVLLRIARQELLDSVAWYDRRSATAGNRLLAEVNEGLTRIAADPEKFNFSILGTRHYRLPTFPYSIHYQQKGQLIVVFAIFHHKRDFASLRQRL